MCEDKLTFEDLGRRGFTMYQIKDGFRFGTDTVLLSWFTACFIKPGKDIRCLELGANCGAATLLLCARREGVCVDAVEIDETAYNVLVKNIGMNSLSDLVSAYNADFRDLPYEIRNRQYGLVFMNPPFYRSGTGSSTSADKPGKLKGRFEMNGGLDDFIRTAGSRLIPSSGIMTMVMTSDRASEAMYHMENNGIRPSCLISVHPFIDKPSKMVLIAGKKTTSTIPLEIMPPLILNEKDEDTGKVRSSERIMRIYEKEHTDCFIW